MSEKKRFAATAILAMLTAACAGSPDAPAPAAVPAGPPSVVLISLDTTRADRLGCYGHAFAATPNVDRLAREGVLFEKVATPVPVTLPAHATLLTGLLPHRHGIRDNGIHRLPEEIPTLAGTLAEAGYDTRAVIGAAVLDRQYGLERGFGVYDDRIASPGGLAIPERRASLVTDAALRSAETLRHPFFLFVHYFDPHADYRPPSPYLERFRDAPYDGEIAYVDEQIGRLRAGLEARGLLDGTIVVLTADHGESLGQHGEPTHGVFLYESSIRVPLIVSSPARLPAGVRSESFASLADVMPTILELAGRSAPEGIDGRSLIDGIDHDGGPRLEHWLPLESEFGYNSYGWSPLHGLTDGSVKWIGAPRNELYDLVTDPGELSNLAADRPDQTERLRSEWTRRFAENRRAAPPGATTPAEESERLARLAALGYVTAPGRSAHDIRDDLPDPKDVIDSLERINEARSHLSAGRFAEATRTLEAVLDASPDNPSALILLGSARLYQGRPDLAVRPFRRAAALVPHQSDVPFNLGLALMGTGDAAGAEEAWRTALSLTPRYLEAAANLIDLLESTGRVDPAERVLRQARGSGLESAVLDYLEARILLRRGNRAGASRALQRALSGNLPPQMVPRARELLVQSTR